MKTSVALSLRGRDWWKVFLPYLIVILAAQIVLQSTRIGSAWGTTHPGLAVLIQVLVTLALFFFGLIYTIIFLRLLAPKVSFAGESLAFRGTIGEFIWMNVIGILLTIVTLTIFLPWYLRRVMDYLASKTSYRGTDLQFLGRGGRLFLYVLLGIWAPLVVVFGVVALLFGLRAPSAASGGGPGSAQLVTFLVTFVFLLYVVSVFVYLIYTWCFDFSWNDVHFRWKTSAWRSFGFVLGQVMLILVTLTVYWPAASMRIYRYFAERTVLTRADAKIGRFGFEGDLGKGFGLIWGQALLSLITAGIYLPWAYANIGRWLVGSTFLERTDR